MDDKALCFNVADIGLSEIDFSKIRNVFATFLNVKQVWLYGSRAKGNFGTYSDIDITLKGTDLNLKTQNQLLLTLDDLYLPYTFDVSIFAHIKNQDLVDHIARVGLLIYERTT